VKLEGLDREELLKRVISLEFDRFLDDYRHGEDLIDPVPERESRFERGTGKNPVKSSTVTIQDSS